MMRLNVFMQQLDQSERCLSYIDCTVHARTLSQASHYYDLEIINVHSMKSPKNEVNFLANLGYLISLLALVVFVFFLSYCLDNENKGIPPVLPNLKQL